MLHIFNYFYHYELLKYISLHIEQAKQNETCKTCFQRVHLRDKGLLFDTPKLAKNKGFLTIISK